MAILSKSITASSLKAKSSGILSVFYKTIDSLQEVVKSAKEEAEVNSKTLTNWLWRKKNLCRSLKKMKLLLINFQNY